MLEIKKKIEESLNNCGSGDLFESSIELFSTLGYNTSRQNKLDNPTYSEFEKNFLEHSDNISDISKFKERAQTNDWQQIEILFQLTDEEMSNQGAVFDAGKVDNTIINAYLFFAIELKPGNYTRTTFSDITRQINRVFNMPVMLLFKYGGNITLSIIKRRLNKKDENRDVLEKVILIKDINIKNPHRAHIEILFDLSLKELRRKNTVNNFVKLQKVWQQTLDSSELNKKFYREIANWYFWAVENVEYPDDLEKNREIRNATAIIRLLTRIIFVWFIKEKSVIPEDLFRKEKLKKILNDFINPETSESTVFYKAILQNLFFATLSTEEDKRHFRSKKWKNGRNIDFGNQYFYRYENFVFDTDRWKEMFIGIPFLNGGLFENLDNKEKRIMVDGFSEEKRNNLKVPDFLFFSMERNIDLNNTYDTKGKNYKVKGLLEIFNQYKFTIAENTPVEEEIALDPELLGKVFENLLASFNPETKTTARKQTGSFYTPREIVDYMVDESLKVSLSTIVSKELKGVSPEDIKVGLNILFAYTEKEHTFTSDEVKEIVKAVSQIKILDPACGSGAFPMGVLHKLTFILNKLDPKNVFWRELQKKKAIEETEDAYNIGKHEERQQRIKGIEETFDLNTSDYGRKLFLIENAIYGVDIQPIAVQISKLRFFISLIVDQDMKGNIKPLPNLETKFVAADTLIGLKTDLSDLFHEKNILLLEDELKSLRHVYFSARNRKNKITNQKKDKEIRTRIVEKLEVEIANRNTGVGQQIKELENKANYLSGGEKTKCLNKIKSLNKMMINPASGHETASLLSRFDPYNQNASSPFFDSEWMYGITNGFDIIIGNPPYVQIQKFSGKPEQKAWANENYKTFVKTGDIYQLFYEKGNMLLKDGGVLAYITSNKWMRAKYGKTTRKYFVENTTPIILIDFGGYQVFESATVDTNVLLFEKVKEKQSNKVVTACAIGKNFTNTTDIAVYLEENSVFLEDLTTDSWIISGKGEYSIRKRIEGMGTPLKDLDVSINFGIKTGFNEAFIINSTKKNELIAQDPKNKEILKPILRGRDIKKHKAEFADLWLINSHNGYLDNKTQKRIKPINIYDYPAIKEHLDNYWENIEKRQDKGITPYNLRNCAYLNNFEKNKIVYPDIMRLSRGATLYESFPYFYLDKKHYYVEATNFFITGDSIHLIIAVLSSRVGIYLFLKFYSGPQFDAKGFRYKKEYLQNFPIPKITKEKQLPFEILVECILFAKEHDMDSEAGVLESVIDGMVYDLYFEEEMKKSHCYITDRITEVIKPFKEDDTDEFKIEYINKLDTFCRNDKIVFHGRIHRRNIKVVKIINGDY